MAIPSNGDELISLFEYFLQDTLPTLLAIIVFAAYSGFVFMFYQ